MNYIPEIIPKNVNVQPATMTTLNSIIANFVKTLAKPVKFQILIA